MRNFINEEFVKQPTSYQQTDLLSETYNTLNTFGVDMEAPDAMGKVFNDESTAKIYIESLAEGLDAEDTRNFMILSENIMGSITGKGSGSRSIMSMLNESNLSASFLPKAKLIFPMFRFTWPRLHIREIVNVVPMDSPEIVRYFFKAICKNLDGSITPLPSYNPLGQGQIIGSLGDPKFISVPGTVNLLADIGASNTNTHLEKSFMIVGWEGIDPSGATVSDVDSATPLLYTTDADGKLIFAVLYSNI